MCIRDRAWPLRFVCILLSRRLVGRPVLLRLRLLRLHLHLHLRLRHLRRLPVEYIKVSLLETKKKKKERADNIVSYVETNRLGFVV